MAELVKLEWESLSFVKIERNGGQYSRLQKKKKKKSGEIAGFESVVPVTGF